MHTGILKGDSSEEEGCRRIIEEIDAFISQCAGKKVSFQVLYNKLLGKDFGTRKGVIPIFVAKEIIICRIRRLFIFRIRKWRFQAVF